MGGRERRLTFGEVAEDYDRVRPGYPSELFELVARTAGLGPGSLVVEVGAGTGKATAGLAALGCRVLALEPDPAMAAVAGRRCAGLASVAVMTASFEDWPGGALADAVFAAQSWHWVDPTVGFAKAARSLRDGGWLLLVWNDRRMRGDALDERLDEAYARFAPSLESASAGWKPTDQDDWAARIAASGRFGSVVSAELAWTLPYPAAHYAALLTTKSEHRLLPEAQRAALLAAVVDAIDAAGGSIEVDYVTRLYAAPVR